MSKMIFVRCYFSKKMTEKENQLIPITNIEYMIDLGHSMWEVYLKNSIMQNTEAMYTNLLEEDMEIVGLER